MIAGSARSFNARLVRSALIYFQDFFDGTSGCLLTVLFGRRFRTKVMDFAGTMSSAPSQVSPAPAVFFFGPDGAEDPFCAIPAAVIEIINVIDRTNRIRTFTQ